MNLTDNTILITGGGTGIGRALAEAFQAMGNQVIIAGRRQGLLDGVRAANPGMKSVVLDVTKTESIQWVAEIMKEEFPELNVVIHGAGIAQGDAESIVATNLLGPVRLTSALLPLLEKQASAAIITVSSGLAFVPRGMTPAYSATKALIHTYTQWLRNELRYTPVQVLELMPPYVRTELMGPAQAQDMKAMPVRQFVAEVMRILPAEPGAERILVGRGGSTVLSGRRPTRGTTLSSL